MSQEKFEQWCLVELFGHSRIAGLVTEQSIGGQSFVRVDVPATSTSGGFTRLFGAAAIYAMNPIAEDIVRGLAEQIQAKPITAWDLPEKMRTAMEQGQRLLTAGDAEVSHEEDGEVF